MRDAPSVQSEFHRVGRSDPPASGSRAPDNKTKPSSSPGPLPATGPLPDQQQSQRVGGARPPASGSGVPDIKTHSSPSSGSLPAAGPLSAQSVQDVCTDTCVKVPYSVCSTVIGQPCPQRVAVPSHTASGPIVPGFKIRRPSSDLVSQSAVQSVSSCQLESAEQSVVGHQHGPGPFGLQSPSDSQVLSGACSTVTSAVVCDPPVPFLSVTPDPPAIPRLYGTRTLAIRLGQSLLPRRVCRFVVLQSCPPIPPFSAQMYLAMQCRFLRFSVSKPLQFQQGPLAYSC